MDKEKLKKLIPLGLIVGGLIYTIIRTLTSDVAMTQRHWIACGLTSVILIAYFINTKFSNIILGVTLVLGLVNLITFTPTTVTIGGGITLANSEFTIALQLFSLIAAISFYYVHRKAIINWLNKDGI